MALELLGAVARRRAQVDGAPCMLAVLLVLLVLLLLLLLPAAWSPASQHGGSQHGEQPLRVAAPRAKQVLPFESSADPSVPFQFAKYRKDPRNGWWAITDPAFRSPARSGCQALEQEVLARGITFLMNENFLPGNSGGGRLGDAHSFAAAPGSDLGSLLLPTAPSGVRGAHLCSRFMNVALFREPVARLLSHRTYLSMLKSKLPLDDFSELVRHSPAPLLQAHPASLSCMPLARSPSPPALARQGFYGAHHHEQLLRSGAGR